MVIKDKPGLENSYPTSWVKNVDALVPKAAGGARGRPEVAKTLKGKDGPSASIPCEDTGFVTLNPSIRAAADIDNDAPAPSHSELAVASKLLSSRCPEPLASSNIPEAFDLLNAEHAKAVRNLLAISGSRGSALTAPIGRQQQFLQLSAALSLACNTGLGR